jgi:outer membrane lipoprotein SlyB
MQTQVSNIEPLSGKFSQAVIWIAGIALTLFCAVGIAAIMGWIPNSLGVASDKAAIQQQQPANSIPPAAAKAQAHKVVPPRPAAAARAVPAPVAAAPVATVATCADCGVIESVREVDAKGKGSGLGAVGGAVLGGLLGNQVGAGHGKDAMTVVGAVGGGLAGNEVEKRMKTTKSYAVTVRLHDGSSRVVSEAGLPSWQIGDKVKIVNGAFQSNA